MKYCKIFASGSVLEYYCCVWGSSPYGRIGVIRPTGIVDEFRHFIVDNNLSTVFFARIRVKNKKKK